MISNSLDPIPTINTITILLHDVIHYSQNTVHNVWKVSRGFRQGRGNDFSGQSLRNYRLENGEQSCRV